MRVWMMDGQIADGGEDKPAPNAKSGTGMDQEQIQLKTHWNWMTLFYLLCLL
jgi:hypothetical protein